MSFLLVDGVNDRPDQLSKLGLPQYREEMWTVGEILFVFLFFSPGGGLLCGGCWRGRPLSLGVVLLFGRLNCGFACGNFFWCRCRRYVVRLFILFLDVLGLILASWNVVSVVFFCGAVYRGLFGAAWRFTLVAGPWLFALV